MEALFTLPNRMLLPLELTSALRFPGNAASAFQGTGGDLSSLAGFGVQNHEDGTLRGHPGRLVEVEIGDEPIVG